MLNMLIIDDEPLVLLTIRSLCNWEDQNIHISGEAQNGLEALKFMRTHPDTDIVMVDVDMPVMNGLEFAEALRKEDFSPALIFLSSYSNFEYVRTAFKSGAYEYILKSEMELQSLLDILKAIPLRKNQILEGGRMDRGADSQKETNESFREEFFSALTGNSKTDDGGLETLFERCNFSVSFPFCFMILRPGDILQVHERYENNLYEFQKTVTDLMRRYVPNCDGDCGAVSYDEYYIFLRGTGRMELVFEQFYKAAWNYIDIGFEGKAGNMVRSFAEFRGEFARCLDGFLPPSRLVIRSRKYIREHYGDQNLNLSKIAAYAMVSKNHLSFEFARETGETISDFITRTRIREAEKLMMETNLRNYEIAEKTGYINVGTFNRAFKRITGKSPRNFFGTKYS
jgi:two-component system response regulator YesN